MGNNQSAPEKNIATFGTALASVPVDSAAEFFNDPDLVEFVNSEDPDLPEDLEANTALEKTIDIVANPITVVQNQVRLYLDIFIIHDFYISIFYTEFLKKKVDRFRRFFFSIFKKIFFFFF